MLQRTPVQHDLRGPVDARFDGKRQGHPVPGPVGDEIRYFLDPEVDADQDAGAALGDAANGVLHAVEEELRASGGSTQGDCASGVRVGQGDRPAQAAVVAVSALRHSPSLRPRISYGPASRPLGHPAGRFVRVIGQARTGAIGRRCSRSTCQVIAVATLTYDYAGQTAVLGRLSQQAEPGAYDLCRTHAHTLSAPRGWDVIRLPEATFEPAAPSSDDLLALADAVREIGLREDDPMPAPTAPVVVLAERRHLRVVADPGQ